MLVLAFASLRPRRCPPAGLEPANPKATDFKSVAYPNSAKGAQPRRCVNPVGLLGGSVRQIKALLNAVKALLNGCHCPNLPNLGLHERRHVTFQSADISGHIFQIAFNAFGALIAFVGSAKQGLQAHHSSAFPPSITSSL